MSQVLDKELSLKCLQDGLFFGLDYLKENLKISSFDSYYSDGDYVLKGQTLLLMELNQITKKEEILLILSYLSGVYTLVSCFIEKRFDFTICASSTKNFSHREGERQAILKAGADFKEKNSNQALNLNEIQKRLKTGEDLLLSEEKISRPQIQDILKQNSQSFDLHGSFLPSDLEEFRQFNNINKLYSSFLEGNFPCLKMKWSE
ncbi:MAG: hypothetical protein GDA46_02010 [Bdellovibrionales bacterium]|nr:hypothetical protein [Bdellovibrionales bacterium]